MIPIPKCPLLIVFYRSILPSFTVSLLFVFSFSYFDILVFVNYEFLI